MSQRIPGVAAALASNPTAHLSPQPYRAQQLEQRWPREPTGPMDHWAGYNRTDGTLGRLRTGLGERREEHGRVWGDRTGARGDRCLGRGLGGGRRRWFEG
jgi:hypothetical protein